MNFYIRLILFLIINFGALGIGGVLQGGGARSAWYQELNIAPWHGPPSCSVSLFTWLL